MVEREPNSSDVAQAVAEIVVANLISKGSDLEQTLISLKMVEARGIIQDILDSEEEDENSKFDIAFRKTLQSYGQTENDLSAAEIQEALKSQITYYLELKAEEKFQYARRLLAPYGFIVTKELTTPEELETRYSCIKPLKLGELVVLMDGKKMSVVDLAEMSVVELIEQTSIILLGERIKVVVQTTLDSESGNELAEDLLRPTYKNTSYITNWKKRNNRFAPFVAIYQPEISALEFLSREYTARMRATLTGA